MMNQETIQPSALPTVFISYSHKDEPWKDRLRPHLGVLERLGQITIWDDRQIDPGGQWFEDIKGVMDRAAVALCLISADYLASDFVTRGRDPLPADPSRAGRDGAHPGAAAPLPLESSALVKGNPDAAPRRPMHCQGIQG
jgi:hypothetical protein